MPLTLQHWLSIWFFKLFTSYTTSRKVLSVTIPDFQGVKKTKENAKYVKTAFMWLPDVDSTKLAVPDSFILISNLFLFHKSVGGWWNETGDRKEESSDSPQIPDRGWGGDIRHPRPLFRGCIQHKFCCYLQSSDRSSYRLTMECLWLCSVGFQFASSDFSHCSPPAGKYFLWQYLIFRELKRQKKTQSMSILHSCDCQMWVPQSWQCQVLSF